MTEDNDDKAADQEKRYYKLKFKLDWVNKFSQMYCVHLGFAININEIMKLFKGCSNMTHRINNKPIKGGFKSYTIVCAYSGYCYFFFPDGLKEKKKKRTTDAVVFIMRILPDRKNKQ